MRKILLLCVFTITGLIDCLPEEKVMLLVVKPAVPSIPVKLLQYLDVLPDQSKQPQTNYSLSELSKFDGEGGRPLYVLIDGQVCDLTHFVHLHPGGSVALKRAAGLDAGAAMRASRMPSDVFRYVSKFRVGWLQTKTSTEDVSEATSTITNQPPSASVDYNHKQTKHKCSLYFDFC